MWLYDQIKKIPYEVYAVGASLVLLATATLIAPRPSELEKKVEQKTTVKPSTGGGSAGPRACPPIIKHSEFHKPAPYNGGNFGSFDSGGFDTGNFGGEFPKADPGKLQDYDQKEQPKSPN